MNRIRRQSLKCFFARSSIGRVILYLEYLRRGGKTPFHVSGVRRELRGLFRFLLNATRDKNVIYEATLMVVSDCSGLIGRHLSRRRNKPLKYEESAHLALALRKSDAALDHLGVKLQSLLGDGVALPRLFFQTNTVGLGREGFRFAWINRESTRQLEVTGGIGARVDVWSA
jgi:hypothetical protein